MVNVQMVGYIRRYAYNYSLDLKQVLRFVCC